MSSLRFSRAFNEASSDVSTKIPTQSNSQEAGVAGEKPLSEIHGACEPRPATTRANKSPAKQREVTYDKMGPFSGLRVKRGYEVWLHVYDLDVMAARMNELFLRSMSLGAYHCGVEVLDREWFASFGRTDRSGVVWHDPKQHSIHIYKESLAMGNPRSPKMRLWWLSVMPWIIGQRILIIPSAEIASPLQKSFLPH
jgi:hypothetical protein